MYVDKMHSAAIRDADKTSLPMTVFRVKNPQTNIDDWGHASPIMIDRVKAKARIHQIITWLPQGYFS